MARKSAKQKALDLEVKSAAGKFFLDRGIELDAQGEDMKSAVEYFKLALRYEQLNDKRMKDEDPSQDVDEDDDNVLVIRKGEVSNL